MKQDRDYYSRFKGTRIAETSKANNDPHTMLMESKRVENANSGSKLIIDKSICMAKFNDTWFGLVVLEGKSTMSTPQKQELRSAP